MGWFLKNLVSSFLLPPLNLIILGAVGIFILKSRPKLGKFLIITAFFLFYILSIPFVAENALQILKTQPVYSSEIHEVQAIVILGGGTYFEAPEYGGHTVNQYSLQRIRYGAYLQHRTGKPVMVTGGDPLGIGSSEAEQMKSVLENEFHILVRWIEDSSKDTRENAYNSYSVLNKYKVNHIALVTHAWHMPRAVREFERVGFKVVPASTAYVTQHKTNMLAFIPSASALLKSRIFIHEIVGMIWYWLISASSES